MGRIVAVVVAMKHPDDITWYLSMVVIWSCAEICTALVALSLPALKGLCSLLHRNRSSEIDETVSQHGNIELGPSSSQREQGDSSGSNSHGNVAPGRGGPNASQERLWP